MKQGLADPDVKRREAVMESIEEELANILRMRAFIPVRRQNINSAQWAEREPTRRTCS